MPSAQTHIDTRVAGTYRFQHLGRAHHLQIDDGADLALVSTLDEALWVANSAATATLRADETFLTCLDRDGDGRIRAEDVRAAIDWTLRHSRDPAAIRADDTALPLAQIDDGGEDAEAIRLAAANVLRRSGTPDADTVTLAEVRAVIDRELARGLSEAGIVLPAAAGDDEALRGLLADVVATVGGVDHPAGDRGVTAARLERFLEQGRARLAWMARADEPGDRGDPVMPLGERTEQAFEALSAVRDKLDEFFMLCDAGAIDARLAAAAWSRDRQLDEFPFHDREGQRAFLRAAPLAPPDPGGVLRLDGPLNPFYADALATLRDRVLEPLGEPTDHLSRDRWRWLVERFGAHERWAAAEPEDDLGALDPVALRRHLESPGLVERAGALLERSHETSIDLARVRKLEQLLLYRCWLLPFVHSFVSFPDLYAADRHALFEMGTLIMDGRRFTLSVRVTDRTEHARRADESDLFVLFVEVADREGQPLYEVAVPVTAGGRGNLTVGKRGLFVDRDGRELHARVLAIVDNPISLREALLAPLVRVGQAFEQRLQQMRDRSSERVVGAGTGGLQALEGAAQAEPAAATAPAAAPAPAAGGGAAGGGAAGGGAAGWLAGGGIAIAALGSSGAFVVKTLAGMDFTTVVGVLASLALLVMIPIVAVAWLKLRRRDLSTLLEGAGWGINARMRLTRALALTFTRRPDFPPGSRGVVRRTWIGWLLAVALLAVAALALWRVLSPLLG